ncbi:outer membrane protein assembly factor BamB family protein [Actinotalea solisilvae]|uniref:outer membrane protein assembly factor BamB family protein n=1 Tax=Actinotalea solisilvae TaxID=2072922 RepID=UPI0018F14C81|nr:PQQ-binding-like beta-propeller repeat protein [Actinotalea solisilvae]
MDRARDVVEVHLDEGDADLAPAATTPRRTVGRRLAVAAVAVAALAAGAASVAEHARDRARAAELAAIEGLVPALDQAPVESWRADASWVTAQVGDSLLVSGDGGASSALDAETGAVLWTSAESGPSSWAQSCTPLEADPTAHVAPRLISPVEVWIAGTWLAAPAGPLVCAWVDGAGTTTVALVDPATGRRDVAVELPGSYVHHQVRDGDVAVATANGDAVEVTRWDPATGTVRWQVSMAAVLGASDGWATWFDATTGTLTVSGERTVTISLDTGEEVAPVDPSAFGPPSLDPVTRQLPDGSTLTWEPSSDGAFPFGSGEVTGPDGRTRFALPGPPVLPALTDGSVPDVVVVQASPLTTVGLDVRTGEERWTADGLEAAGVVQMDGTLVVRDSVEVRALDVRTGEERWTAGAPRTPVTAGQTDGRIVLLGAREDGQTRLVARRIADGETVWSVPLPEGTWTVQRLGPAGLIALGGKEIARLDVPTAG